MGARRRLRRLHPEAGAPTRPQTPIPAGGTRPAGVAAPLGTGVTPGNVSPDWFHPGTSCPEQTLPSPGRGRAARRVRPERRGRGQEEPGLGPERGPGERKEEGRGDLAGASVPGHSAPCGVGPSVLPALGTSVDASCWSGRAHGLEASGGPHGRVLFGVLTDGSLNPDSQPPGQRQTSKHGAGPWGGTDMPSPGGGLGRPPLGDSECPQECVGRPPSMRAAGSARSSSLGPRRLPGVVQWSTCSGGAEWLGSVCPADDPAMR